MNCLVGGRLLVGGLGPGLPWRPINPALVEISSGLDSNPTCSSAPTHDFTSKNY